MPLLDSNLLRRIAIPLRRSNPRLYETLYRVRRRLIAGGSGVRTDQAIGFTRFRQIARLQGARVLEIGSDRDMNILRELSTAGVAEAIGVNKDDSFWSEGRRDGVEAAANARLQPGDATALEFDDDTFDYVFSVATFEHIQGLERALAEIQRVLKPGGLLYSSFGPIWSGPNGHHLNVHVGTRYLSHTQPATNPLPPHAHLLLSPDEMRQALAGRVDDDLIEPIVHAVYERQSINRLFRRDYLRLFDASGLRRSALHEFRDPVHKQFHELLRFRYPSEDQFDVTLIETVFTK